MVRDFLAQNNIPFLEDESLKNHTTFKVGGKAKFIAMPNNTDDMAKLLKFLKETETSYYFLGKGSNVIFKDEGFNGVVIKTSNLLGTEIAGEKAKVGSGTSLNVFCKTMQEHSLSGVECCYGIPGSVGGAVFMNAGAYGGEISDNIFEIEYLDENFNVSTIKKEDAQFSYRNSIFQHNNWLILSATFHLSKGDDAKILSFMDDIFRRRTDKQPLDMPSAGSSFKRPQGHFAAALIEQCGLKGFAVGGAQISLKHAGFIINTGNASCKDIVELATKAEEIVLEKTGVKLEKEMIIV